MTNVTLLARNTLYYVEWSELSKLQAAFNQPPTYQFKS